MKRWAIVVGGVVVNIVEQETAPAVRGAQVIEAIGYVGPGYLRVGQTFQPPGD